MKKFSLLALLIVIALIGLSGCEEDTSGAMAGTWTLDSTQTTAGAIVLGDGNFTLNYLYSASDMGITAEMYTGSGTIGGEDYLILAGYSPTLQMATISLYQTGEDPNNDSIDLDDMSYSGGDTLNGDYAGWGTIYTSGAKNIGSGIFTASR